MHLYGSEQSICISHWLFDLAPAYKPNFAKPSLPKSISPKRAEIAAILGSLCLPSPTPEHATLPVGGGSTFDGAHRMKPALKIIWCNWDEFDDDVPYPWLSEEERIKKCAARGIKYTPKEKKANVN
jgi:hypothetical protein